MSALKYRDIGFFPDMELVSVKRIPGDEKQNKRPKVQLNLSSSVRLGQGINIKVKGSDFAKEAEMFWKCKVTPELFSSLSSLGLKIGSIVSIKAAIDNWGSQEAGGAWYEFIELVSLDGKELSYQSPSLQDFNNIELESIEKEINCELATVGSYGY